MNDADENLLDDKVQLGWSDPRLAIRLLRYLWPYLPQVIAAAVLTLAITAVTLLAPYLVGRIVDDVLRAEKFALLYPYGFALLGVFAAGRLTRRFALNPRGSGAN